MSGSVGPWIRTLAALDVPGRRRPPQAPLDGPAWHRLLAEAGRRRLVGALAWAIHDGRWPADDPQREAAEAAHEALVARDLLLERHLVAQVERLRDAGIEVVVLKGPAMAACAYRRSSARSFRDIDLLVPGSDLPRAVALLEAAGARRHFPEPRPGYDARFTKGAALTTEAGMEVDLHRTLAAGPYGFLVDPATIVARAVTVPLGGVTVRMPDLTTLAVHACLHAVLGEAWPPPEVLRDVAVLFHHPGVDPGAVVDLAAAWQAETVVSFAIGAAWTDLALDPDHPALRWADRHRPTPADLRRLDPYVAGRRDDVRLALAATRELAWRDRPAYLRAVALPDRATRGHRERWARGLRRLADRAPGGR